MTMFLSHHETEIAIRALYDSLISKGFMGISVPALQNADKILDTIGERARSELFFVENTDPEANVLRYDFTLPIAFEYLQASSLDHRPEIKVTTKGSVFRRRSESEMQKKSEFDQIGFEYIGHCERTKTDAECLATLIDAIKSIKNVPLSIEIADIGLSRAICDMPIIPPMKAGRLRGSLRYREKFMRILKQRKSDQHDDSFTALSSIENSDAEKIVEDIFKLSGLKHSGLRNTGDIIARFIKKSEEQQEADLDHDVSVLLARFYDLECPATQAADKIRQLFSSINPDIDDYLEYFQRRLDILKSFHVDIDHLFYGPLVKRKPEYYSGFMFSVDTQDKNITHNILAGGGRYDDLFKMLGAKDKIPAVGAELRPYEILSINL